jgi:hypothetical protein
VDALSAPPSSHRTRRTLRTADAWVKQFIITGGNEKFAQSHCDSLAR